MRSRLSWQGEQRATQGKSDYCQPPYVSTSYTQRSRTDAGPGYIQLCTVTERALMLSSEATPMLFPSFFQQKRCTGRAVCRGHKSSGTGVMWSTTSIRSCPEVQRDGRRPPGFLFSGQARWHESGGEAERNGSEGADTKQLLIQSSTGEGDNLTSCRCCHGYQSPMCHGRLAPRPCPDGLPFNRQRIGTKGKVADVRSAQKEM